MSTTPTMDASVKAAERRRAFMMAHDHLISPWKYSPLEIQSCDGKLRMFNWARQQEAELAKNAG